MEHLELASEALRAFSEYAEEIERMPSETDVLVLRMHSDGSGRVVAAGNPYSVYLQFSSLADLLSLLGGSNKLGRSKKPSIKDGSCTEVRFVDQDEPNIV